MAEQNQKIYITTPIYYVNDKLHLGHAYTTLAADILARYHKLLGRDVFFLTGTDEHGAKIAQAAEKNGKTPKDFCDEIAGLFQAAWRNLGIEYSHFIRTTDPEHEKLVGEFLTLLKERGFLYEGEYNGLYCVGCEKFITEKDLVNGFCPDHKTAPQVVAEKNWFFKLRDFLPQIEKLIVDDKILVRPANAKQEVLGLFKRRLDDISVSRQNVAWGIKLPWDESQTIYVWIDALLNYWTAVKHGDKQRYWPPDLHLLARDILKFHCVYWPALLLAAGLGLPKQIFCHGYFTINGQKMSKTIGNVIDPNDLIKKYGVDATRYLLLAQFPFGNDGDISLERLDEKYNSDLANGLGNLLARVVTLAEKLKIKNENDFFKKTILDVKEKYKIALENLRFDEALGAIWELMSFCDKYINDEKPWETGNEKLKMKNEKVIEDLLLALQNIAEMLKPFLPQTAEKILGQIKAGKSEPLFPRI